VTVLPFTPKIANAPLDLDGKHATLIVEAPDADPTVYKARSSFGELPEEFRHLEKYSCVVFANGAMFHPVIVAILLRKMANLLDPWPDEDPDAPPAC
jgi:hypothetical protein